MIQITRSIARQFRAVLRRSAPSGSPRSVRPALVLQAGNDGLRIRSGYADVAVELHQRGAHSSAMLALSSAALDDFEGKQDSNVTLIQKAPSTVEARWEDGGVPQCREYAAIHADRLSAFPAEPRRFTPFDASFLKAFDAAAQTASRNHVRIAFSRLQLRGESGEIIGTDGRHLLIQRGFSFPWKESILVPALGVFGISEFCNAGVVAVGKTDTHICIRVGPWKWFLQIDKASSFPRIDQVIPKRSRNGTDFHTDPQDAAFLLQALPELLGHEQENADITIDLNGNIAIRGKDEKNGSVTELVLSRSKATGPPIRLVANRQFLLNAARMGLGDFHVVKPSAPVVARDRNRIYVFVPLNEEEAIPPTKNAVYINSAGPIEEPQQQPSSPRRTRTMPSPQPNGPVVEQPTHPRKPKIVPSPQPNGHANGAHDVPTRGERPVAIADLIAEAEELRTVLADAQSRVARLLSSLKMRRRDSRVMQQAVQSLKQLKLGI